MVFLGSWLSGFFIVAADAWMQHPVAYSRLPDGGFQVSSFWGLLTNPWALLQYAHTMSGAGVTGAFVMAGTGAYYLLSGRDAEYGRIFVRLGVIAGTLFSCAQIFPTGDLHGKYMARHQPVTTAAMEALFHTQPGAPIVIMGQPDIERRRIDNPIAVNNVLSFLIYGTTRAEVRGLDAFPPETWPTNVPLLYFSYHVMAGLGTLFVALMVVAAFLLWRRRLYTARPVLWALMLAVPFPYIANTAGWLTAEVGPPALARLRPGAHRGRFLPECFRRQRPVYAARIYGHVRDAEHFPALPGAAHSVSGAGAAPRFTGSRAGHAARFPVIAHG